MGVLGNYMNPYTQINIDQGVRDLNKARMQQLQSDQDAQIGAGAFGGSRGAILEAETNKNYNESVADFVDKKREDAFNVATKLASDDIARAIDTQNLTLEQMLIFLHKTHYLTNKRVCKTNCLTNKMNLHKQI